MHQFSYQTLSRSAVAAPMHSATSVGGYAFQSTLDPPITDDPHQRCGVCGIERQVHTFLTNHTFDTRPFIRQYCPTCKMLIHVIDDNFERHTRNCFADCEKPFSSE